MSTIRNVCVYCGSGSGNDPAYAAAAEELGSALAREGLRLVYGGGSNGLMGITARTVIEAGGHVTGIIPTFLKTKEKMLETAAEMHVVPDMHTRKQLMFDLSDAFVALPGGVGTLEEVVEQMTWAQLGRHGKPILLVDVKGFWKPLLVLLAHMRQAGFIRAGFEVTYLVAERVEDVVPMLRKAGARVPEARAGLAPGVDM